MSKAASPSSKPGWVQLAQYTSLLRYRSALASGRRFHPKIDEAAEGLGARGLVRLTCGPGGKRCDRLRRKAKRNERITPRCRASALFRYNRFA